MVRKCFCALRQNAKLKGNRKQKPGWEHTLSLKCLSSVERQMLVISWWNACAKIIFGLSEVQWTSSHALEVPGQTSWQPQRPLSGLATGWGRRGPEPPQGPLCSPAVLCPGSVLPSTYHSNLSLLRFITWLEHFIHHSTLPKGLLLWRLFSACSFF